MPSPAGIRDSSLLPACLCLPAAPSATQISSKPRSRAASARPGSLALHLLLSEQLTVADWLLDHSFVMYRAGEQCYFRPGKGWSNKQYDLLRRHAASKPASRDSA
jgi:hypothetical protein